MDGEQRHDTEGLLLVVEAGFYLGIHFSVPTQDYLE